MSPAQSQEPEVIVTCMKQRFTGVSGTVNALLPVQARSLTIGYVGTPLPGAERASRETPGSFRFLSLTEAVRLCRRGLPDGRPRLWHVRRNHEMLLGLLLRDVLRLPIRLVFTSAAIRLHSWIPRRMIGRMDRVIATTEAAARLVPNAAAVVGHGVPVDLFRPPASRNRAWRTLGLPGSFGIGTFGRVREEKGVHLFVRAMLNLLPEFPGATAVIVGLCQPGDAAFVKGLKEEIERANLVERFVWVGEVAPELMPRWYQAMSVVVACPLYEGYGLTVIEAMACGCPVVASRTGAFEAMIEPGESGHLVEVGDFAALAQAVRLILADPSLAEAMGHKGRDRAVSRFSVEAEAHGIERVYRDLWAADGIAA